MSSSPLLPLTTPARRRRTPGRPRRLLSTLIVAMTAFGMSVAVAPPASAASGLSYCFRHYGGGPYTYDTYLQLYYGGGWQIVYPTGRSVTGCNSYVVPSGWRGYASRVVAYYRLSNGYVYYAATPYYAYAGQQWANLGTGYVNN